MDKTTMLRLIYIGAVTWQQGSAFSVQPSKVAKASLLPPTELRKQHGGGLFQSAVPLEADLYDAEQIDTTAEESSMPVVSIVHRGGEAFIRSPGASLVKLYNSYLRAIEDRPLLTKGITAAVVNFLGDILAQFLEASTAGAAFVPNWVRLQGFFLCGLIYTGPYVHTWYEQLWKVGSWMEKKYDSPKEAQTLVQLLLDQTIGVAIFFSTYFYVYEIIDALVSHRLPIMSAATAKITDNLGSVLLTNYYFWPAVNFISFRWVPVQLRVLLNNVVGVLWNAFLCTKMAG